ncbi:MAG: putative bifunctional diguanylate cyclase/phosphodiesterase [Aquabacterium sp.]
MAEAATWRWRDRIARHMGVSAKLYTVAFLLLAALAFQAGGSVRVAGMLKASVDQLVNQSFDTFTRAERIQEVLAAHRHLIEDAAASDRLGEVVLGANAHRSSVQHLHRLLHREATEAGDNDLTLNRLLRDLVELELTGNAVLEQALLLRAERPAIGGPVIDPSALPRSLRVFTVAAGRIGDNVRQWRQDRWSAAKNAADTVLHTVDGIGRWTTIAALATTALGLFGLLVLRGVLRQVGGITGAVLRVARHEADITVPSQGDPGPIGDIARAVAILAEDVRELERRGIAQAKASQLLDAALNNMTQGLVTTDAEGRLQIWNHRFAAMLDLAEPALAAGMTIRTVLATCQDSVAAGALAPPLDQPAGTHQSIVVLDRALVIRAHWVRMRDGGWLGTFDDITRIQRNEAKLVHMTRHDLLTDLPNRTVLREAVARAAARLAHGTPFAVLSVNLDRFRTVNDTLGHEAGDALLRQAAARLQRQVRADDTVARIGSDSFAIVQTALAESASPAVFAHRLIEVLSEPYIVANATVVVGASVGIALPTAGAEPHADREAADADALLRNADLARQHARQDGGGAVRFFVPEMDANAQERRLLENDLRQALERREFELHYQPLISVQSRRICAFEALLRWHHPVRGLVRPDMFIPLAEEVGLIAAIGEWVLRRACVEAAGWPDEICVAVNLSPLQFTRDGLVEQVEAAIADAGIAPSRLELEITERVLLRESADTLATLHRLRALGVRISMDDFGTGYSSLSYLRSFPFDKIKIDKSFVHGLDAGPDGTGESEAIVRAIAGLGRSLGIATTAEGVETVDQLNTLVADGCTEMQGYLFSPPRPAADVARLLAASGAWPGSQELAAVGSA